MDNSLFRQLNQEEENQFRQWARKNWHFGMEINETWHPVVRNEIRKIKEEIIVGAPCEQMQNDLIAFLDGMDSSVIDRVCEIVVQGCNKIKGLMP